MTRLGALLIVLAIALPGCAPDALEAPPVRELAGAVLPGGSGPGGEASGTVTVAVPDEPAQWWPLLEGDVAAADLAALWGLPLLRVDDAGQLRPGLARDWTVVGETPDGWAVDLRLASGTWADGGPVTAADVSATVGAALARAPEALGNLVGVETSGEAARVLFVGPTANWADVLIAVGPVVPAATAEAGPGEGLPPSGGSFRLVEHDPGLRAVFEAHAESPLGAPGVERVVVLFVPRYETALGLLEDGEVDVVLGHLALNAVARAEDVAGVEAAVPVGGTTVSLRFRAGGRHGGDASAAVRRGFRDRLDLAPLVEGLLGEAGVPASTPWPGVPLPAGRPGGDAVDGESLVVVLPEASEVLVFTARAIERDLSTRGVTTDLVQTPTPHVPEALATIGDVALVVARTSARPPLGGSVSASVGAAVRAGEAAGEGSSAGRDALQELARDARTVPLYRPGVLHAWRGVEGIRPSAWDGAGFWNVGDWAVAAAG